MRKKDLMLVLIPVGFLVGYYLLKSSKIIPTTPSKTPPETIRSEALSTLAGSVVTPIAGALSGILTGVLSGLKSVFASTPTVIAPNYVQPQSQDIGGWSAESDFAETGISSVFSGAIDYSDASYGYGGIEQNF